MIHTHDAIRKHLEKRIRPDPRDRPSLSELRSNQWSDEFEQYMRNRLIVGAIRYKTFDEKRIDNKYNTLDYVVNKTIEYRITRNKECLVDAANLLMIEFECPTIPNTHFTAEDDTSHVSTNRST